MLLKKIKTNYLDKLLSDLVNQNEFLKIHHELDKLKNEDNELYFLFQNRILNTYLNNDVGQSFFQNKIIWLNSFDLDDTKIIENFLSFYLKVKLNVNLNGDLYLNEFQRLPKKLIEKNINFNDLVENSYIYQYAGHGNIDGIIYLFASLLVDEFEQYIVLNQTIKRKYEDSHTDIGIENYDYGNKFFDLVREYYLFIGVDNLNEIYSFDPKKYSTYKMNYIKHPNSKKIDTWELLIDTLND